MKIRMRLLLIFGLAVSLEAAAVDEPRSFSFDNGEGLGGSATHYRFDSRHGAFAPHIGMPVSRFFLHQSYGPGALHYGGLVSEDERHYYGGLSVGPATLAYFQGEADTFSRATNPLYGDLNQYFFHGGKRSNFEFRGTGMNLDLPGGLSSQFVFSNVTAPRAEDRNGYYLGVASRHTEAGVFQFERGGERVGGGLKLGLRAGSLGLRYQEVRSVYDAHVRRLGLQWAAGPAGDLSLDFEQARNDLYSRDDEQRIMLRFKKRIGGTPVLSAAQEEGAGEQEPGTGFGKTVGIGVGLGAAAVALSSGGGDEGAPRFASRNEAATSVLNQINPVSVRRNIEHGGWVYRNADNTFSSTTPVMGTLNSVDIGSPATSTPSGTVASASYHTHGGPDPRYDNENFSAQDILSDRLAGVDGYLGTPAGYMKLHHLRAGTVSVVGRINN